jgi:hypothetical protein
MMADSSDEHAAFWRGLQDHEFFGPRVQHLYFYSDVNEESVLALRREVLAACQARKDGAGVWVSPPPIVIHVHSPGGSMHSENWRDIWLDAQTCLAYGI